MTLRIAKWGNSLGLRLPKRITEGLNLSEGSEIEIIEKEGSLVLLPKHRDLTLEELVNQMSSVDVKDQHEPIKPVGKEQFWLDEE